MAWRVWMPVSTGEPSHAALNFTGMVLLSLKVRSGLAKSPPAESAPPMGSRKPVKPSAPPVTVTRKLHRVPSAAEHVTVVVPPENGEPEGGEHVTGTALPRASVAVAAKLTAT